MHHSFVVSTLNWQRSKRRQLLLGALCVIPKGIACADRDWNHQSRDEALPKDEPKQAVEVEPNYGLSGKLAEESNTVRGVVMLHNEPPEARKPSLRWRLYTFKNGAATHY